MKTRKILSLLLALLLCVGLLPLSAMAEGEWDNMGFTNINITNAGADELEGWVSGSFSGFDNGDRESADGFKTRVMVRSAYLRETMNYYFPPAESATTHELTLYGKKQVTASSIQITGATLQGSFVEHTYGRGSGKVYFYVGKISVPNGCTAVIKIDGKTLTTISMRRLVSTEAVKLVTGMETLDYTENASNKITSFQVRMSGFNIYFPNNPEYYKLGDGNDKLVCSSVSNKDDVGCFVLTFNVGNYEDAGYFVWRNLTIRNEVPTWFNEYYLKRVKTEKEEEDPPFYMSGSRYVLKGTDEMLLIHKKGENQTLSGETVTFEDEEWPELYIDHTYYMYDYVQFVSLPTPYYCLYSNWQPTGIAMEVDESSLKSGSTKITGTVENVGLNSLSGVKLVVAWYRSESFIIGTDEDGYDIYDSQTRFLGCATQTLNVNGATAFSVNCPAGTEDAETIAVFLLDGSTFAPLRSSLSGWYYAEQQQ
jgi:hypothetical protein